MIKKAVLAGLCIAALALAGGCKEKEDTAENAAQQEMEEMIEEVRTAEEIQTVKEETQEAQGEKNQTMDRKPTAAPAPAATIQPEIQQTMPPTAPEELTAPSSEAASGNQKEEKKEIVQKASSGVSAWELLWEINGDRRGNKLLSKTSLDSALALAGMAASDEAKRDIEKFTGLELDEDALKSWQEALNTDTLRSANGIFISDQYTLRPEFAELAGSLGMTAQEYTSLQEGQNLINQFVNQHTDGMIPKIIYSADSLQNTVLALINAMYFEAEWGFEWTEEKEMPFYPSDSEEVTANFVYTTFDKYYEHGGWYGVKMDYKDGRYSMYAAIPMDDEAEVRITREEFEAVFGYAGGEAIVYFPTFTYEVDMDLVEVTAERCPGAFRELTGLVENGAPSIGSIYQKAKIEVTKEGTKAAVTTGILATLSAQLNSQPAVIKFDHPFVFVIRDNETGEDLFTGLVNDPA